MSRARTRRPTRASLRKQRQDRLGIASLIASGVGMSAFLAGGYFADHGQGTNVLICWAVTAICLTLSMCTLAAASE